MSISTPVAELLATLGIDLSAFQAGLVRAKADMREGATEMARSLDIVQTAFAGLMKLGPGSAGNAGGILQVPQIKSAIQELETYGKRVKELQSLDADFQRQVRNRDTVYSAQDRRERDIDRQAASMDRGHERDRISNLRLENAELERRSRIRMADVNTVRRIEGDMGRRSSAESQLDQQFRTAMNRRDMTFAQDQEGPGMGYMGHLVARVAAFEAVYKSIELVKAAIGGSIERAVDLKRQGEQTGLGIEGAQRLQRVGLSTDTPTENLAASIARFQQRVEEMSPVVLKAFDNIHLRAADIQRVIAGPDGVNKALQMTLSAIPGGPSGMAAFRELFGGRGGRELEALKEYTKELDKASKLTADQVNQVARIKTNWEGVKAAAEDAITATLADAARRGKSNTPGTMGQVESLLGFAANMLLNPFDPSGAARHLATIADLPGYRRHPGEDIELPSEPAKPPLPQKTPDFVQRGLDRFSPTQFESASRKMLREFQDVELGHRQGFVSDEQYGQAKQGLNRLLGEEAKKEYEKTLHDTISLLNEFGVTGKKNMELMQYEWGKLNQAFREGKVGIEDLAQAHANYLDMVREKQEGFGLDQAFKMFAAGEIDGEGLDLARKRDASRGGLKGAQDAYRKGEIGAGEYERRVNRYNYDMFYQRPSDPLQYFTQPDGAGGEIRNYRSGVRSYRPSEDRIPAMQELYKPQSTPTGPTHAIDPKSNYFGGKPQSRNESGPQINVVALDDFSETLLNRFRQQGLITDV